MKQLSPTCSERGCNGIATTRMESTGLYLCKQHKAELDAKMAVVIDRLAHKLAAMNEVELKAWMKSDVDEGEIRELLAGGQPSGR